MSFPRVNNKSFQKFEFMRSYIKVILIFTLRNYTLLKKIVIFFPKLFKVLNTLLRDNPYGVKTAAILN